MAVLYPRIRTINVRLSEDEYLALEQFCAASGARSMSDLVRTAMHKVVTGAREQSTLASSVDGYSAHVKDLERKVATLAAEVARLKVGAQPHSVGGTDDSHDTPGGNEAGEGQPSADVEGSSRSVAAEQPPREATS